MGEQNKTIYVVMGVCGCGKTTIGKMLAERRGVSFYDADDFHPAANIEKMRKSIPLTDDDRRPWLEKLADSIAQWEKTGAVLACSALKQSYRDILNRGNNVRFIYLKGTSELISGRMGTRSGHYMPASLIKSQFETLQEPKNAVVTDISVSPKEMLENIISQLDAINIKRCHMDKKVDIGLIGLAVMGENLILNLESKGFCVSCYNRTISKVDEFMNGRAKGKNIIGCRSLEELVATLQKPRKVMLMVKAGKPVDEFIDMLLPLLEDGDIIIDGGNSHFPDTIRRTSYVEGKGKLYIGTGVSGGEEGALKGPSIMPGGSPKAWQYLKPIFQKIAAHTDDGQSCCDWVGENGAGHFVKMVHNGIEYGDMQIICEAYHLLKQATGFSNCQMHEIFRKWDKGQLKSYLIEITADILSYKDENGKYLLDVILDSAGQKGTGKWTVFSALDTGQPLTLIAEAVFARCLSSLKDERTAASKIIFPKTLPLNIDKETFVNDLEQALYASKIVSYAQGYQLMRAAAAEYKWNLNYGGIALMWRGGCIIRSAFLDNIKQAFEKNHDLVNLLLDPFFKDALEKAQVSWRRIVAAAVQLGIPVPALSSALSYFDGYRTENLPANLLQAQRDYFGAHTYERIDKPRGQFFHTNWTGHGGATSSSTYNI